MRRVVIGWCAAAAALTAACTPLAPPPAAPAAASRLPSPSPPSATTGTPAPPEDERLEVTDLEVNACNGETVVLSGELHAVTTGSGATTSDHIHGHLTGTGSLGNDYVFNLQVRSSAGGDPTAMTVTERALLVSKGSAPNQLVISTVYFAPMSIDLQADCRG
jgi:hypothetical protein